MADVKLEDVKDIKPCPFCGSKENLHITSEDTFKELFERYDRATLSIECRKCGLDLYEHKYSGDEYEIKRDILIKKWNRRAKNGIEKDQ